MAAVVDPEVGSAATWTRDVKLTHPTRGLKDLPSSGSLKTQEDANQYIINAIEHAMVSVGPDEPEKPVVGQLWWSTKDDELTLYIYVEAEGGGFEFVPAAPPVSLNGITDSIANIDASLMQVNANIAMNKKDIDDVTLDFQEYKEKIDLLETELDKLEGVYIDVVLEYKFGFAPQRPPQPGCAYLRYGDDNSSQKPTYAQAHWLNVSPVDQQGNPIDWMSVNSGDAIVIENVDGSGFGAYLNYGPIEVQDDWIKFQMILDPDVENNGVGKPVEYEKIRIKVSDAVGLSSYVRKAGDTMNGTLRISQVPEDKMGKGPLELYGLKPSPTNSEEIITAAIFAGGHMPAGSFLQYDGRISNKADLVNKGYVDSKARTSEIALSQLGDDVDPELKARMEDDYDQATQEDLNNEIGWTLFNQRRRATRTSTNLDIIQSTVADGQWNFVKPSVPASELPQIGDFFCWMQRTHGRRIGQRPGLFGSTVAMAVPQNCLKCAEARNGSSKTSP